MQHRRRADDRLVRGRRPGRLVPALAIMLGANVGTTLIVQLLSFDISAFAPFLFLIGLGAFRIGGTSLARAIGRVAIGLGLMLLALHMLIDTLAPAEQAPAVHGLLLASPATRCFASSLRRH